MTAATTSSIILLPQNIAANIQQAVLWAQNSLDDTKGDRLLHTQNALNVWMVNGLAGENYPLDPVAGYLSTRGKWDPVDFNPHSASTGGTLTANAAGTTEVAGNTSGFSALLGPILLGAIIFHSDCAAGKILLRDAASTGQSVVPRPIAVNTAQPFLPASGMKFQAGIAIVGDATGISCTLLVAKL